MEALAERLGRRPRVGREAVDEPLEVGPPAVGRGVERPDHTWVGRVEDAQSDQRVEQPRIDARRPHDERELLGRISLAGQVAAQGTQHPPDRARVLDRQPVDPHVGNDRVEDEPGDVRRVPQRIPLCDEGPVRHAVEVQLVDPERAAEQIEVLHRLVGAEEPALRADRAGASRAPPPSSAGRGRSSPSGPGGLGTGVRSGRCRAGRSGPAGSRRASARAVRRCERQTARPAALDRRSGRRARREARGRSGRRPGAPAPPSPGPGGRAAPSGSSR